MEKKKLTSFIDKYYLAGSTNNAKLIIQDKNISCDFITDDRNVVGKITSNGFDVDNCELGVYATSQLLKIISALDADIKVEIKKAGTTAYSIQLIDNNSEATFMLADLAVISQVPQMKQLPNFDAKIKLTKEFTDRYIKAKNALPDSLNFAVSAENNQAQLIVNYSTIKTSRICFNVEADVTSTLSPISFNANTFKEILMANKDADSGTIEVSSAGLARVIFTGTNFTSTYYLVQLQAA
jgi:hypothetical protein